MGSTAIRSFCGMMVQIIQFFGQPRKRAAAGYSNR
jgi:hypothetical protein